MKFPLSLATFLLAAWTSVAGAQLPAAVGETPVPSLAPMLKRVSPAVVNIATRGTVQEQNPLLNDPFFRRFFDVPNQQPRQREFQSAGSGVIVDAKNGYIITNAHVVENATDITVQLLDNRSLKAKVIGTDPGSDVAVLKVQAGNLVDLPIADSDRAEVGDFVVAIGNPFGLGHTVTSGIVSALGRSGINPEGYEDFIQTDASINPGNSGGALVNLSGQLVGVNSAILSRTGGNIGIGFAIPSNMMKTVMNQLIKFGTVKRGVLGVNIQTLVPEIATSMDLPEGDAGRAGVAGGRRLGRRKGGRQSRRRDHRRQWPPGQGRGQPAQFDRPAQHRREGRPLAAARRQAASRHRGGERARCRGRSEGGRHAPGPRRRRHRRRPERRADPLGGRRQSGSAARPARERRDPGGGPHARRERCRLPAR